MKSPLKNSVVILTLFLFAGTLRAEDVAAPIAPFLELQTIAVLHVDLSKLDITAATEPLLEHVAGTDARDSNRQEALVELQDRLAAVGPVIADLVKDGAHHAYLLLGPEDLPGPAGPDFPGVLVVPVEAGGDAQRISAQLSRGFSGGGPRRRIIAVEFQNAILVGLAQRLSDFKSATRAPRPDIAQALNAHPDAPIQLALTLSSDIRRILESVIPDLTSPAGTTPITHFTRNIQWASLGIKLSPHPLIHLTIQCTDDSTKTLAPLLNNLLSLATPLLHPAPAQPFKVEANGAQLTLTLDDKTLQSFTGPLIDTLAANRERALRVISASNMRMMLQAIVLYQNDHPKTWPDTLHDKALGLSPVVFKDPRRHDDKPPYIYLKPTQDPNEIPLDWITLYENPDGLEDGVNVGFADGHVDFYTTPAFKQLLAKQQAAGQKPQGR